MVSACSSGGRDFLAIPAVTSSSIRAGRSVPCALRPSKPLSLTAPDLAGTPRASTTRRPQHASRPLGRRARLSREATRCHAGRRTSSTDSAPRASRVASRPAGWPEAPPWHTSSARTKARAPSRRFAGRPGAAPTVAAGDPRVQVGPRTSRPARGMHFCSPKRWLSPHSARRVPRLCAPLPESRKVAPPDNGPDYRQSRAWVRGHARVRSWRSREMRGSAASLKRALCT